MDKLLSFGAFFLVYAFVLIAVVPAIRASRTSRVLFVLLWSLYMAVHATLFPHLLPGGMDEEVASIKWTDGFVRGDRERAQAFLRDNCTLIDVSGDLQLVPNGDRGDDSLFRVITHRGRLAELIEGLCALDTLFDLVIVDVVFPDARQDDERLQAALVLLAKKGKLALAYDRRIRDPIPLYENDTLRDSYGDVSEKLVEDVYFQHTLVHPAREGAAGLWPSLPYRAYTLLADVHPLDRVGHFFGIGREVIGKDKRWVGLRYSPRFLMADEPPGVGERLMRQVGIDVEGGSLRNGPELVALDGPVEQAMPMSSIVNQLRRDSDTVFVREVLRARKEQAGPHLVVVGNFLDKERDRHPTVRGEMQGAVMIVNVVHELLQGEHARPFLLLLFTWLVLAFITAVLLHRSMHPPPLPRAHRYAAVRLMRRAWSVLFVKELHYWLLFALLIMGQWLFRRTLNVMGFVLLLAVAEFVLKTYLPQHPPPKESG